MLFRSVVAVMGLKMERSSRPSTQLGCEVVRTGQSSWFTEPGEGWRHFPRGKPGRGPAGCALETRSGDVEQTAVFLELERATRARNDNLRVLSVVTMIAVARGIFTVVLQVVSGHGLSCPEACGIFLTQGSNLRLLHLLHWQGDSLSMSHLGSPRIRLITTY